MDTTKLIEEAQAMASRTLDPPLPPAVEALLTALAAALKASEESLQDARAELAQRIACIGRMEEERRALQSANLAANKRIVELEHERDAARAELARLTTPRPLVEAPRKAGSQIIALWMHGDEVESMDVVCWADMDDGDHPERKFWMNTAGDVVEHMTHFLPLPEVKRPCWEPKP